MKRGFPRPYSESYKVPVPYTAVDDTNVGTISDERIDECLREMLCAVCGEALDSTCCLAVRDSSETVRGSVTSRDTGISHEKCAKIVESFCPEFKSGSHFYIHNLDTQAVFRIVRRFNKNGIRLMSIERFSKEYEKAIKQSL